jgi:hypothetical protein
VVTYSSWLHNIVVSCSLLVHNILYFSWLHNIVVTYSLLVHNILIPLGHIEGSGFIAYFSLDELCCKCNVM